MAYNWNIDILYDSPSPINVDNLIEEKDLQNLRNGVLSLSIKNRCTANFYSVLSIYNSTVKDIDYTTVQSNHNSLDKTARFQVEFYSDNKLKWLENI